MAISPDGRFALVGTQALTVPDEHGKGELFLWDLATGEIARRFENTADVTKIDFNAAGDRALTSSAWGKHITLWDVTTGQPITRIDHDILNAVAFSPDETAALGASEDGRLLLWDLATGEMVRLYIGHDAVLYEVLIHHGNRTVVSNSPGAGSFILWDFDTAQELRRFGGPRFGGWPMNIAFHPNGNVLTSSEVGDIIEWRGTEWTLVELLDWIDENRYIREFTCEEREQYRIEPLCE